MKYFLLTLTTLLLTPLTHANPPALSGYSPVAYFTEGKPTMGSPAHAVTHQQKTYHLQNAAEVTLFNSDPDKYTPRYSICPYSLALGKTLPLDPTNFQIIGGYLLLFHKSDAGDGLYEFRQSGLSEEELLNRADKEYVLLEF